MSAPEGAAVSGSMSTPEQRPEMPHCNSHTTKSSAAFPRFQGSPLKNGLSGFAGPRVRSDGLKTVSMKFKRQSMNVLNTKLCAPTPNLSQEKAHELLSLCSQCIVKTSRYYAADGYTIYRPREPLELLERLAKMRKILESPNIFEFISDTVAEMLLEVLNRNLLRELPDVPKQFVLCDQIAKITSCNKPLYMELLEILALVLKNCKISQLVKWMTPTTLRSIVRCMETPDEQEQAAMEGIIHSLCTALPDRRLQVYDLVMERLQMCAYGMAPYHFILPGLHFLISNQKSLLICPSDPNQYIKCIVPLYRSMFLPVFSGALCQTSALFYSYFDELPELVLRYLFKHWPETDSEKVPCFLDNVKAITPLLGVDTRNAVAHELFERLEWCAKSLNCKVLQAAFKLFADKTFMSYFSDMSDVFMPMLYPHVKRCLGHWNSDVDRLVPVVLLAFSNWNPECYSKLEACELPTETESTDSFSEKWASVFELAKSNDPDLKESPEFLKKD